MSPSRRRGARWVAARCLLVGGSLLGALAVAEGVTRWRLPHAAPRSARVTRFWQYHPRYGWSHRPNVMSHFESFGFSSRVSINARGFRGPLASYERPAKRQRALVLGDSYVWGFGVSDHEVFTAVLERMVPGLEAINLGVSGYSTDQELLLYTDEGYKYDVDWVVLVVASNDFPSNLRGTEYLIYPKPFFSLDQGALRLMNQPVPPTPAVKRLAGQLAMRSYFLTLTSRLLEHVRISRLLARPGSRQDGATEAAFPRTAADHLTVRLLLEMKNAVQKQSGAKLLVVLVDGFGKDVERVAGFLEANGVNCFLLDRHLDYRNPSLHLPDGFHWSPKGHEVVARALAPRLQDKSQK